MNSFYILLVLIVSALLLLFVEYRRHLQRLTSISVRIHINGTRGKSSVTRLIGAGVRAGGKTCITKVTGTFPRLILQDGTETHIHRKSTPNILEQLSIVKYAAKQEADVLVMECMALQPQYQVVTEDMMLRSDISVITNIRLDHVDIMGYTLQDIAQTIGGTIPRKKILFTTEHVVRDELQRIADNKGTVTHFVETNDITREEMAGFSYIEHPENVALALAVCQHLGIERKTAICGMHQAIPDAGVLRRLNVEMFNKKLFFYNAFAANDPDSTMMIWNKISNEAGFHGRKMILLNTRRDRLDRAKQLAEMVATQLAEETECVILIGESCDMVEHIMTGYGFANDRIINLGWTTPEKIFETVLGLTHHSSTTVAVGNMGGLGAETVQFFEHRSTQYD
jgi:gamma-polyglutamate synthase